MSGKRCEQCGNPMYYDEDFCTKCYPDGWGPAPGNIWSQASRKMIII